MHHINSPPFVPGAPESPFLPDSSSGPVFQKTLLALSAYIFIAAGCVHQLIPGLSRIPWGVIFGGALILFIFLETASQGMGECSFRREDWLVIGIVFMGAAGIPSSLWPGGSFKVWNNLLKTVLIFFTCSLAIRRMSELTRLVRALAFSILFLALAAVAIGIQHSTKGIANTYDPNDVALLMVMGTPFCFFLATQTTGAKKLIYLAMGFLFAGVTVLTGSRGGVLGLASLVCYAIVTIPARRGTLIIVSLVAGVALFSLTAQKTIDRISTIWNPQSEYDRTAGYRTQIWKRGVEICMSKPIFGVGMGNFADAEGTLRDGTHWHTAHNSLVQVAAEMGVPVLVMFVTLVFGSYRRIRRLRKCLETTGQDDSPLYPAARALEFSLVGYMICGFFLSQGYLSYLYFVLGLTAAAMKLPEAQRAEEEAARAAAPRQSPLFSDTGSNY